MNENKNDVTQNDVTQDDVTQNKCNSRLNIRMPGKLRQEINKQADELGMSASTLAKVVLAQQFIKH